MIEKILILVLLAAAQVEPGCKTASFTATAQYRLLEYIDYSNNDDCTVTISPSSSYRSGYYLEIKWIVFDIDGDLPNCKDYIEVYLTRAKSSIGKYCSGNTGSKTMFNMYSSDGYAVLRFKSDSSITKKGFRFSYQLRSFTNNSLGEFRGGACYYLPDATYYGLFYSSGWPKGYANGTGFCYHAISVPKGMQARIVAMDLDLRKVKPTCDGGNDYFQMRVSNKLYNGLLNVLLYSKSFSSRHCGTYHPGYWNTSYSYVYLLINKPFGSDPLYSNRGALMAYLFYSSTPKDSKPQESPKSFWAILGGSIGGGVLLISSIAGLIIKKCKDGDNPCCHIENIDTVNINCCK